jgi:hypothetical protein
MSTNVNNQPEETIITPAGKKSMVFAQTKQRSKGLTKTIQTVFFPEYKYDKLRGQRKKGTLTFKSARQRGKTIDNQLSKCIGQDLKIPPYMAHETKLLLNFIRSKGFYIEKSQQAVGFAPWRLATSLDLVLRPCSSINDHRIVVEVKRGCLYRRCNIPGKTSQHLQPNVTVSPLHMHQLQVIIGAELLRRTDSTLPIKSWLLYVDETELEIVDKFEITFSDTIDTALLVTAQILSGYKRKTVRKSQNKIGKRIKKKRKLLTKKHL